MKPLSGYVNTLMVHTPKGVKRGGYADRVFAVVGTVEDMGRQYLLAWKCTLLPNGKLDHPAYKRPLDKTDPRLWIMKGRNKSEPTAMFRPDSLYRLLEVK